MKTKANGLKLHSAVYPYEHKQAKSIKNRTKDDPSENVSAPELPTLKYKLPTLEFLYTPLKAVAQQQHSFHSHPEPGTHSGLVGS